MKLLNTKQLADRWSMHDGTLRNWRTQGKGPPFTRIGGGHKPRIRYRIGDVRAYEQRHRIAPRRPQS
jgi:hypothetical protein